MIRRLFLAILLSIVVSNTVSASQKPEIFVQMGHTDNVTSVVFSPDGKYLVSGSMDKSVKIWEIDTGREIRTLRLNQPAGEVALSPDGKSLAVIEINGFIRLWNMIDGKELQKFSIQISETLEGDVAVTGSAKSIAFSTDGKSLIVASNIHFQKGDQSYLKSKTVINIWDVKTGKLNKILPCYTERISDMALSPDGTYVFLGSETDNAVIQLDIKSGKEVRRFAGHAKSVHSVTVSPDGKYVVSGSEDRAIVMWNAKSGKKITTFTNHQRYERFSIAFSPDGKRLIVSGLNEMELWDVATGNLTSTLKGSDIDPWTVIFSPHGTHVAFSYSRAVAMWDTSTVRYGDIYYTDEAEAKRHARAAGKIRKFGGSVYWIQTAFFSYGSDNINMINIAGLHDFDRFTGVLRNRKKIINPNAVRFFEIENDYSRGLGIPMLSVIDSRRGGAVITTGYDYTKDADIPDFMTFSPDGRYAVGQEHKGGRFTYKIIDIRNKREISTLEMPPKFIWEGVFSPDGKYVAGLDRSPGSVPVFTLWDVFTGKVIRTFSGHSHFVNTILFTADGSRILSGSADTTIKLWETATGREIRTFQGHTGAIAAVDISSDGKHIVSGDFDGNIKLWEMDSGREIKIFSGHINWVKSVLFSPDNKYLVSGSHDGTTRLWDIKTGKEIAQFISFTDGEWIVITPEGYFNASLNGDKHLNVRIGSNVYGIENYREAFYRPDLVKLALAGGTLKDYKTLAEVKQSPLVEIINAPISTDNDEIKVTLRLTDQGGGIGDVRLYLNETAVLVDSARGIKITPKPGEKGILKIYTIKLLNGENIIKAVASNGDNTMQSNPAYHRVMASIKVKKPTLYAVVIGINEYRNPKLELKYAVADARLFAETLKTVALPIFEKVEISLLTTKEDTTKDAIKKALEGMKRLIPEDVFVFYVASHGTVDEGEYFLITSNVGSLSTFKLKEDALTQTELKELIANVPSTKKFIVIDTCNAGQLGEALQVAMLTRGMSEETAMKILSKAVGSTILSASTSLQEALEGYQGHGLFTYVLTEGMKGKADTDRDGFIRTLELANYVDSEVPSLAEKVFKRAQYPTATPSGQAFPIGKIK